MKIIFLIGELRGGGAEGVVATLCNQLSDKGHNIVLISHLAGQTYYVSDKVDIKDVRDWQYDTKNGSLICRLYKKIANRFLDLKNIRNIIKQESPDVVISFLVAWLWQLILICKGRYPLVCAERNAMIYPHSGRNFWNKQILYRFADVVQVMSKHDKAWLRNRYKRVIPMPNPLRFPPITVNEYDRIFETRKNILACGRVNPQKGYEKLIESFSLIADEYKEWDVDICGDYSEDDEYYRKLIELIKDKGLQQRIHFIGFHKDVDSVMRNHSIFCLSSQHEGFPNVLSEAMANGLACVSFDIVTGPSEIVIDGLDGIIVENQNNEALAEGMSTLIKDKGLRYKYGKRAVVDITRFNKDIITDKWEQFFFSVKRK